MGFKRIHFAEFEEKDFDLIVKYACIKAVTPTPELLTTEPKKVTCNNCKRKLATTKIFI